MPDEKILYREELLVLISLLTEVGCMGRSVQSGPLDGLQRMAAAHLLVKLNAMLAESVSALTPVGQG